MVKIKAIIVDDEELGRRISREYLASYPEIEIIGECRDAYEALAAIEKHHPDLVFLDIQMPEINGFEMLELLEETPKIVFSTAYDRYAIRAFEINAVDYLLKPYDAERFDRAVDRVIKDFQSNTDRIEAIQRLIHSYQKENNYLERLLIKQSGRIVILATKEINFIKAMDDYAEIHTNKESYLIQQSLNRLESRLSPKQFIRAHRSFIANIDTIKDIVLPLKVTRKIRREKQKEKSLNGRAGGFFPRSVTLCVSRCLAVIAVITIACCLWPTGLSSVLMPGNRWRYQGPLKTRPGLWL